MTELKPHQEEIQDALEEIRSMDLSELEQRVLHHIGRAQGKRTVLGTLTGRFVNPTLPGPLSGIMARDVILDECSNISPLEFYSQDEIDRMETPGWKHPIPIKGAEVGPSDSKRAKLRAKRKKRK